MRFRVAAILFTHHPKLNRAYQHSLSVHVQRANVARKMWALGMHHANAGSRLPCQIEIHHRMSVAMESKGCKQKILAIFSL